MTQPLRMVHIPLSNPCLLTKQRLTHSTPAALQVLTRSLGDVWTTALIVRECHAPAKCHYPNPLYKTVAISHSHRAAGRPRISSSGGGSSPVSSGIAVSAAAQPSDEEPATASDSSSGADPWTVVTSPSRRTAPSLPAAVPEAAAVEAAAPAAAGTGADEPPAEEQPAGDAGSDGATAGAERDTGSGSAAGEQAAAAAEQFPASPQKVSLPLPVSEAATSVPAAQQPVEDDDEEDDLGDIEAAPNDDGDEDVDEDWGYESA